MYPFVSRISKTLFIKHSMEIKIGIKIDLLNTLKFHVLSQLNYNNLKGRGYAGHIFYCIACCNTEIITNINVISGTLLQ